MSFKMKHVKKALFVFIAFLLMTTPVLTGIGPVVKAAEIQAEELFFSEYIEGGSNNKALEIYNGTGNAIDLSGYTVELYSNGKLEAGSSLALEGTLNHNEVYVIAHSQAGEAIKEQADSTSAVVNFNGDDALVLKKNNVIIDVIHTVGSTDNILQDLTLVRKSTITKGSQSFQLGDWEVLPKDAFVNIGFHQMGGQAIEEPPVEEPPAEIEVKDIQEIRNTSNLDVAVEGIVTAIFIAGGQANVYIQDSTAGIIVRAAGLDSKVNIGDKIKAAGKTTQYYDMAQITATADTVSVVEKNAGFPSPQVITSADLTEAVEGELVTVKNVSIESVNNYGEHTAIDEKGSFLIDSDLVDVGKNYDQVTGVVEYSFNTYRLIPRNASDVIEDSGKVSSISANPEAGIIAEGTKVELTTSTENITIHYTTDGSEPTVSSTVYTQPIEITEKVTIKAIAVKEGLENSDVATFLYEIGKDLDKLEIHDIQGESHTSPYKDKTVKDIDGIVTHIDGSNVYIQEPNPDDNPKTSEGLLVYKRNHGVKVGDHINVAGQVKEYYLEGYAEKATTDLTFTEINATSVEVLSSGNELPAAIVLGKDGRVIPSQIIDNDSFGEFDPEEDGLDFYESLEGMRVQLDNATVVGPQEYGDVAVVVDNGAAQVKTQIGGYKLTKNDYNPEILYVQAGEKYAAKVGDTFEGSITGVLSYDFGTYKVYRDTSESLPKLRDGGVTPEKTSITKDTEKLSVATYNIENFSAKTAASKVEKIAKSIIENLDTPDILGLVEVQDNDGGTDSGTTSADESYKVLVDKIKALGGPSYEFTDIASEDKQDGGAPGGNIRVGYLYNPERVLLVEGEKGSSTEAVDYKDGSLTLNPGRISPDQFPNTRKSLAAEFEFNGEKVIVINNHFNSKTGDSPLFGQLQPPVLASEEERINIASVINGFVKEIMDDTPDANIIVLGDMNDFEFSKPLEALKGAELVNMIDQLPEEERWTYNYRGNSQTLDHILVNNRLAEKTEVDIVNINSAFMEEHGRASDHDPVLIQVDLQAANDEAGEKSINILHTNDVHARYNTANGGIGYAKLATLVKQYRAENEHTLLLDMGDTFHGTTFATLERGSSIMAIMNKIGYDGMTLGNHDFNYGYKHIFELEEMADFPLLSANIVYEETGELVYDPYTIKEVNGVEIGMFGLSTPETHFKTHPKNVEGLIFTDPVEAANEMVEELEAQGVDAIVVLSHLGTDASSEDTSFDVAEGVTGIDLIIDGHSHTIDEIEVNDTLIVSTGEYLENLGSVELTFDENDELINRDATLITTEETADIEPDPEVAALISELEAEQEVILAKEIGETKVHLDGERTQVRTGETNLGNLITDAMLEATGADIALTNGGGIRASIDKGIITKGEVITVLPFGNYIQTVEVPGSALKEALEMGVNSYPEAKGAFPHIAGFTFAIDVSKPVGERVHSMKMNGEPMDMDATYTLATNDFLAAGGDEYTALAEYPVTGDFSALDEAVMEYIKQRGTIEPTVEGRIIAAATPIEEPDDDDDNNGNNGNDDDNSGNNGNDDDDDNSGNNGNDDDDDNNGNNGNDDDDDNNGNNGNDDDDDNNGNNGNNDDDDNKGSNGNNDQQSNVKKINAKVKNGKVSISTKDLNGIKDNGTLIISVGNANVFELILTSDQVALAKEKGLAIQIENKDMKLTIPAENLPDGDVVVHIERMKDIKNALSAVYDFMIISGGVEYHQFDRDMTMEFKVTGKVNQEDRVKVYYYNEKTEKWELIGGKYENGVVTATTNHFSSYAVFEINANDDIADLAAPEKGYTLPNTATDSYNLLMLGLLVAALGTGITIILVKIRKEHSAR